MARRKKGTALAYEVNGRLVQGPFCTSEEREKDIALNREREDTIVLGTARNPAPEDYFSADAQYLADCADFAAIDDACFVDDGDVLFACVNEKEAQEDLDKVIKKWAKKWFYATAWSFERD